MRGTKYSSCRDNDCIRYKHFIGQRGNACILGLEDKIGTLDVGTEADVIVLNSKSTGAMALRMDCATSLSEELFILQMMGDDRAITEVYVAGEPRKS